MRIRSLPARLFWVGCLTVAVGAVVVVALRALEPAVVASSDRSAPTCRSLDLDEISERVTCRTASATLTIAAERHPLVLDGTEARVLGSELSQRTLVVRVRLRNPASKTRIDRPGRRQLYVSVGGERTYPLPIVSRRRADEDTRTLRLRFPLASRAARRLRRGDVRAELGVVPWEQLGRDRPSRLGVVRLDP